MELDINLHTPPLRSPTPTPLTSCTDPFPFPSFSGSISECGSTNAWQQLCSLPPGPQINTSSSSQSPINTSQEIEMEIGQPTTSSLPALALLMVKSRFLYYKASARGFFPYLMLSKQHITQYSV